MTRLPAVVLMGVALSTATGSAFGCAMLAAGAGARGGTTCGPASARTLARGSHARVYAAGGRAFGCTVGAGRSFRLGGTGNCINADRVGPIVLAGNFVAFASERCGVDTGSTRVLVVNLRDGKRRSATTAAASPGPESYTSVASLVARSDGAAAWIAVARSLGNHLTNVEVRRVDAHGAALLDSGMAIGRRSLRLHRSTLSWSHGGQPRSARLA